MFRKARFCAIFFEGESNDEASFFEGPNNEAFFPPLKGGSLKGEAFGYAPCAPCRKGIDGRGLCCWQRKTPGLLGLGLGRRGEG